MSIATINMTSYNSLKQSLYEKKVNNTKEVCKSKTEEIKPSLQDEIKATIPGVNIDIGQMPTTDRARESYAFGCAAKGFSKNITIPQNVFDKMEEDPQFKQRVLNNLQKEFSQRIPNIPGMKVLAHGAVVDEDGSVGGWIVGGPDGSLDDINRSKRQRRKEEEKEIEMKFLQKKYLEQKRLSEKVQIQHVQSVINQNRQQLQTLFEQPKINIENVTFAYEKNMVISDKE